jgi:hypothetical protein
MPIRRSDEFHGDVFDQDIGAEDLVDAAESVVTCID